MLWVPKRRVCKRMNLCLMGSGDLGGSELPLPSDWRELSEERKEGLRRKEGSEGGGQPLVREFSCQFRTGRTVARIVPNRQVRSLRGARGTSHAVCWGWTYVNSGRESHLACKRGLERRCDLRKLIRVRQWWSRGLKIFRESCEEGPQQHMRGDRTVGGGRGEC